MNVPGDNDNVTLDLDDSNDYEQKEDDGDDDSTNFCQTCLIVDKTCNLKDITKPYAYNGNYEIYSDMLEYCFSLQPGDETNVPYNIYMICETCIKSLRIAANFRHLIEDAQETINGVLEAGSPEYFPKDYQGCLNASKFSVRINPAMDIIEDIYPINIRDIKTKHMCNEDKSRILGKKNEENNNFKTERGQKEFFIDYRMKLKPSDQHCKFSKPPLRNREKPPKQKHVRDGNLPYELEPNQKQCKICDKVFVTHTSLKKHMPIHFTNFTCKICGKVLANRDQIKRHMLGHPPDPLKCPTCPNKIFKNSDSMKVHYKRKHGNGDGTHFRCNKCSERFSCYSKRAKHIEDVHGFTRLMYKCTVCDLTFTSSGKRSTHIRMVHLRERNHICPVCKRAFFTRRGLQLHITAHTGRRNFPCDVCYKAFSRKSALTQHMIFHASNKDYVCHICDAAFAQKSIMKEHMNTHLLRDYKEEICDYEYQD